MRIEEEEDGERKGPGHELWLFQVQCGQVCSTNSRKERPSCLEPGELGAVMGGWREGVRR
jgi:hypothetical protein